MSPKASTAAPNPDLDSISALAEPTRRALYAYVVDQRDWVSRDQAAQALGVGRATAAHHLDRLAADGLVEVDFQRRTQRRGPGAGRPAKVYRRAQDERGVTLPPRRYDLAARLLADAIEAARRDGTPIDDALVGVAREAGHAIGASARVRLAAALDDTARRDCVHHELSAQGFEPDTLDDGVTVLRNCPFHQLAQAHPDLICSMNLHLLGALLVELDAAELEARLEPEAGSCCVRIHPRHTA